MRFSSRGTRRAVLAAAAAIAATTALVPASVSAQEAWPSRPIKLIVPFAAGGGNDAISRLLATKLGARLGQPIVIENKGGSGGAIGTDAVAKAPADGYTLLFASTSITTNAASGKALPYELEKDLQPIGQIGASPLLIVVTSASKTTTMRELLDSARAKPDGISYGSGGVGAMSHLGIELLASDAKVKFLHVPYKGTAVAFTDLIAGHLQMLLSSPASAAPYANSGRIRNLAQTGLQRSPFLPDLPTVAESGVPGFQLEFWWGLLGPAKMPPAVVKRLNEELNWVLAQPDTRELLARESATPRPGTPDDLRKLVSLELARWKKLIKEANIKMD